MAEVELKFEDRQVRKFLNHLVNNVKKVNKREKDYVTLLSAIVFEDIMDHFEKQMGPEGKWKSWSEFTKMIYAKTKPQHLSAGKILQDTGQLRGGLMPIRGGGNFRKTSDGILWFNPVKYAAIHDQGGPFKAFGKFNATMPKRSFMWLSSNALDKISLQTLQFVMDEK